MSRKGEPLLILTHMDTGALFGHQSDERAFFEWLKRIPCIDSYHGDGRRGLVVKLKRRPSKDALWQLLALCHRYGVDMRQLAKFKTEKNSDWFCDRRKYWYQAVFGKRPARKRTPRTTRRRSSR